MKVLDEAVSTALAVIISVSIVFVAVMILGSNPWTTEAKIEAMAKEIVVARAIDPSAALDIARKYYREISSNE